MRGKGSGGDARCNGSLLEGRPPGDGRRCNGTNRPKRMEEEGRRRTLQRRTSTAMAFRRHRRGCMVLRRRSKRHEAFAGGKKRPPNLVSWEECLSCDPRRSIFRPPCRGQESSDTSSATLPRHSPRPNGRASAALRFLYILEPSWMVHEAVHGAFHRSWIEIDVVDWRQTDRSDAHARPSRAGCAPTFDRKRESERVH